MVQNILNFFTEIDYKTFLSTVLASSVFTTVINGFFSWKNNRDRISADIKAKARIEWIQDVKKSISEYISSIADYTNVRKRVLNYLLDNDSSNNFNNLSNDFFVSISNMDKCHNHIAFCFANNYDENIIPNPHKKFYFHIIHPKKFKNMKLIYYYQLDYLDADKDDNDSKKDSISYDIIMNAFSNYQKNFYIQQFILKGYSNIIVQDVASINKMINDKKIVEQEIGSSLEDYNNKLSHDLSVYISRLNEIISIYLKIEWDIAKKGK